MAGWQLNTIANFASGTPFTVYDSANVALQGSSPEITGFYSSRPDLVGDPKHGAAHSGSLGEPLRISAPGPVDGGRAVRERGPQRGARARHFNVDVSLLKNFAVAERARLQFRAECFNLANHAEFRMPDNDIASPNFGRALQAGAPRLFQFGIKLIY